MKIRRLTRYDDIEKTRLINIETVVLSPLFRGTDKVDIIPTSPERPYDDRLLTLYSFTTVYHTP